jgi:hypothetical protein
LHFLKKVDVRLVNDSSPLHGLPQIRRLDKLARLH